jgi:CBS domain-containing protein
MTMTNARGDQDRLGGRPLVADAMSHEPLLLRGDMRLEPAIDLLVVRGYSGAPVIGQRGRLVGMLHAVDVAIMHLVPMEEDARQLPTARHILVREVCRGPVTISPTSTVQAAATKMRTHRRDRLAVVDGSDHVVGVITGHDLLRTLRRRGDLLRDIVDEQITALDLPDLHAAVDFAGVVLITGTVNSVEDRQRVLRAIGTLDGVTEVDELLTVVPPRQRVSVSSGPGADTTR